MDFCAYQFRLQAFVSDDILLIGREIIANVVEARSSVADMVIPTIDSPQALVATNDFLFPFLFWFGVRR